MLLGFWFNKCQASVVVYHINFRIVRYNNKYLWSVWYTCGNLSWCDLFCGFGVTCIWVWILYKRIKEFNIMTSNSESLICAITLHCAKKNKNECGISQWRLLRHVMRLSFAHVQNPQTFWKTHPTPKYLFSCLFCHD